MNILIVDKHHDLDGRVFKHIRYLLDAGLNVYHLHFDRYGEIPDRAYSHHEEKGYNIPFCPYPPKHDNVILKYLSYLYDNLTIGGSIRKGLADLRMDMNVPTIIHVHDPELLGPAKKHIVPYFKTGKLVYDRHEVYENYKKDLHRSLPPIPRILETLSEKKIDAVVTISEENASDIARLFPKARVIAVPNYPYTQDYDRQTIEEKVREFDDEKELKLLYIGSLNNGFERDITLLLNIMEQVLSRFPEASFTIGGATKDREILDRFEKLENMFGERFSYIGYVKKTEVIKKTQKAHLGFFLLRSQSSYWVKCSPNKVFENMYCGVITIIKADIEQADRVVRASLLSSRDESEEEIVSKVIELLKDHRRMKQLMTNGIHTCRPLTWETVARRYIQLYEQLLQ